MSSSATQVIGILISNFSLIKRMVVREILGRYKGSVFGITWSLFNPLLMLVVYTFVFSSVFKAKWPALENGGTVNFALLVFSGMVIHSFIAECLNKSPTLFLENSNYVTKVVFPLEALNIVIVGSALFHLLISLAILVIGIAVIQESISSTLWQGIFLLPPLCMGVTAISWMLSSLGVYIRDLGQVITLSVSMLLFVSPVFFPLSSIPEQYQIYIQLNPMTWFIENLRNVTIYGYSIDPLELAYAYAGSYAAAWLAYQWFKLTRHGFSDVL
ncbi:ABC transporter permease [Pseudomonas japonica]|uniref:ABC transporter permease n=1 Tax=Pseudomonas japonica TaxID=256466 RepID=UPI0015E27571|nr:ABC transporter permease [Pseudomonas japonica]MBA1241965.1 ABC transporter permease [Pseudomonas japonica]